MIFSWFIGNDTFCLNYKFKSHYIQNKFSCVLNLYSVRKDISSSFLKMSKWSFSAMFKNGKFWSANKIFQKNDLFIACM